MTRDNLKLKAVLVLVALFLCNHSVWADDEWDKVTLTSSWSVNSKLTAYSTSAGNLSVWNGHAETAENKKNKTWTYHSATYTIPYQEKGRVYGLQMSFQNDNYDFANKKYKVYTESGKDEWINDGNYWTFIINYKSKYGSQKYWRISYHNTFNGGDYRYNSTSIHIKSSSSEGSWKSGVTEHSYNIYLMWGRNYELTIHGFDSGSNDITLNDVESITSIEIGAGPSAYIKGGILQMLKESDYLRAQPYLEQANEQIQNGNYNSAANTMTKVIDNIGYKKAYIIRGYIYTQMEYYKTALEDFNKAVTYATDTDERETAYYYRGICKLCLEDVAGAVSDLRSAGQQGRVLINEYELDKYQSTPPAQRRKPTTNTITKPSLTK